MSGRKARHGRGSASKATPAKPKQKPLARTAKPAALPPAARAFTATEPKSILEDGKGSANRGAIQPSAALSRKPAASPAKTGTIAAKPKPAQSSAVGPGSCGTLGP